MLPLLPDRFASIGRFATNARLGPVQRYGALQRPVGKAGAISRMDVKELGPDVHATGNFLDTAAPIKPFKNGIAVSM